MALAVIGRVKLSIVSHNMPHCSCNGENRVILFADETGPASISNERALQARCR